jgi:carbon-monoxide dehydrogenase small subunit
MTAVTLTVNGDRVDADIEPRLHLADLLRERLNLTGTHLGCEQGACGACTVLLNGVPVRSCLTFAVTCQDADIRTIEGFDDDPVMARLRDAFSREHGLQCGFCTPGMLVTARDIVTRLPGADATRIRRELSGNLCRCTGYVGIVKAVTQVAAEQAARSASAAPERPVRTAPRSFTIAPVAAAPTAQANPATPGGALEPGWTRLTDGFTVPQPIDTVWALFADLPRMIACMPGASLDPIDGPVLKGRMQVKLGPISAAFTGAATVERDDAAKRGIVSGSGGDGKGSSRARGRVIYQLTPDGAQTQIALTLEFVLQGALAQFGRSGLVKDLVGRLVRQFADNLARAAAGQAPAAEAASLGVAGLFWAAITARIRAWFGRR